MDQWKQHLRQELRLKQKATLLAEQKRLSEAEQSSLQFKLRAIEKCLAQA